MHLHLQLLFLLFLSATAQIRSPFVNPFTVNRPQNTSPLRQNSNLNLPSLFGTRANNLNSLDANVNVNLFNTNRNDVNGGHNRTSPSGRRVPETRWGGLYDWADVDYSTVDRRAEEGWWHLAKFGELTHDVDIAEMPWNEEQIDLDFFLPFAGFRYNYTFIWTEGFISMGYHDYIQPPYTFPNPKWPKGHDPSIIAAFMAAQTFMHVGKTRISHVWFRVVARPPNLIKLGGNTNRPYNDELDRPITTSDRADFFSTVTNAPQTTRARYYKGQLLKTTDGRVEDPEFLNEVSEDIRRGMVGARGFTADYALVVTWHRMAYGGAPKSTHLNDYQRVKRWQNTYQMVLATDEIRTYSIFNFANINWTTSTSAGSLAGRGGKQSALVGFNGGNGTGFTDLPYSAEGNSYKLVHFGSTPTAGRWLARIDEQILYGGCRNDSTGILQIDTQYVSMLGGFALNVTGPCFRPNKRIMMQIDELTLNCFRVNMAIARCVIPPYSIYRQGIVDCKISIDGGNHYPYFSWVYVLPPNRDRNLVSLWSDPVQTDNAWGNPEAGELTLRWDHTNITSSPHKNVDIIVYGYWEDVEGHDLSPIGYIGKNVRNTGEYTFEPSRLSRNSDFDLGMPDAWKYYTGGTVVVKVAGDDYLRDMGDLHQWSTFIGLGFYWLPLYKEHLGDDWALDLCIEWFEYDGRRQNFIMDLEQDNACPCVLEQALADFGRWLPLYDCDKDGDSLCYFQQGNAHCVISSRAVWTGSAQMCCYGGEGYLSFSDDYEYDVQYIRFMNPGIPYRAHPWGAPPYKRPPYLPALSHFHLDLLPRELCCLWGEHCEFYYWRRQTSTCQGYKPPVLGMVYGQSHYITYDGLRYSFQGKGYFVLTMMESPVHDLMVQIRAEQPPDTVWGEQVAATVITGVAAQDNGSALIEVFARKEYRRWRYRTDFFIDGRQMFFDTHYQKTFNFPGVNVRVPSTTFDQQTIEIMFATGVGIRVQETRGILAIEVVLPPSYNATRKVNTATDTVYANGREYQSSAFIPSANCDDVYQTQGLLGTFNMHIEDELMDPDCGLTSVSSLTGNQTAAELERIYRNFGEKWRADGNKFEILFNTSHRVLYNPLDFADRRNYDPNFSGELSELNAEYSELEFSQTQINSICEGFESCRYDFTLTGTKEIAQSTLKFEKQFMATKQAGEISTVSCGNLWKDVGVLKYPPVNNYLDGALVTFDCQPEYFLHGEKQRTCKDGLWSPGWWAWCRSRHFEYFLKWLTALSTTAVFGLLIGAIFCCCYLRRRNYESRDPARGRLGFTPAYIHHMSHSEAPSKLAQSHKGSVPTVSPSVVKSPAPSSVTGGSGLTLAPVESTAELIHAPSTGDLNSTQNIRRLGEESSF